MNWKNYKLFTIFLAMLFLPLMLQAQGGGPQSRPGRMWRPDSLNLTAAQKEQLQTEQQALMKQMIQGQADLRVARLDLYNLIKNGASDKEVNQQVEKVIQAQGALLKARTNHLLQVRKILDEQQFAQWLKWHGRGWGQHAMPYGGHWQPQKPPMMRPHKR